MLVVLIVGHLCCGLTSFAGGRVLHTIAGGSVRSAISGSLLLCLCFVRVLGLIGLGFRP